jgi:CheY-like chemotaxis protein
MTGTSLILVVEDNDDDVALTRHALNAAGIKNPLFVVDTGPRAIEYLSGMDEFRDRSKYPLPAAIFLDLKLPLMSGHEVLGWIRAQRHLESITVVVLTSSDEPSDLRRSYCLGANCYLVKPLNTRQLLDLAKAFNWSWLQDSRHQPVGP